MHSVHGGKDSRPASSIGGPPAKGGKPPPGKAQPAKEPSATESAGEPAKEASAAEGAEGAEGAEADGGGEEKEERPPTPPPQPRASNPAAELPEGARGKALRECTELVLSNKGAQLGTMREGQPQPTAFLVRRSYI